MSLAPIDNKNFQKQTLFCCWLSAYRDAMIISVPYSVWYLNFYFTTFSYNFLDFFLHYDFFY